MAITHSFLHTNCIPLLLSADHQTSDSIIHPMIQLHGGIMQSRQELGAALKTKSFGHVRTSHTKHTAGRHTTPSFNQTLQTIYYYYYY